MKIVRGDLLSLESLENRFSICKPNHLNMYSKRGNRSSRRKIAIERDWLRGWISRVFEILYICTCTEDMISHYFFTLSLHKRYRLAALFCSTRFSTVRDDRLSSLPSSLYSGRVNIPVFLPGCDVTSLRDAKNQKLGEQKSIVPLHL